MPLPWAWPAVVNPMASAEFVPYQASMHGQPVSGRRVIQGDLIIEWKHETATANPRILKFTDGIKATYGPTTVVADELTLYLDEDQSHGEAIGHVHLTDPEGTAAAAKLVFNWKLKTGSAYDAHAVVQELIVDAREIDIKPGTWDIYDFSATNCAEKRPLYLLTSPHATIRLGHRAVIEKPRLDILGMKLGPFPKFVANLDQRATGVTFPALIYRKDRGLGVNWASSFLVAPQTDLSGAFTGFRSFSPSYVFQLSHSLLKPEATSQVIAPRSELDARFNTSYFENIGVTNTHNDESVIRAPRSLYSVGTYRNVSAVDRLDNAQYSKPLDLVFEHGGALNSLGYSSQIRFQSVQRFQEATHRRIVTQTTIDASPHTFAKGLEGHLRFDANAYLGGGSFGWVRTEAGLTYRMSRLFRLGGAAFAGREAGDALYADDRLYVRQGLIGRVDLDLGATELSLLSKLDVDNHKSYDQQVAITQAVGGLDVIVLYRKFPGDFRIGIQLRINSFMAAIKHRNVSRPANTVNSTP